MEPKKIKEEVIKRYCYLYENAEFILAPFMYEETKEEREKLNNEYKRDNLKMFITDIRAIYLQKLPYALLLDLEELILGDEPMEGNFLYFDLEKNKNNKDYLAKVKEGLKLLEKRNQRYENIKEKLDIWKLLTIMYEFIQNQSADLKNREKKLLALDEYFRILRYQNDGKIWTSGASINMHDVGNTIMYCGVMSSKRKKPSREKWDTGLENNSFINFLSDKKNHRKDNESIFSEDEKQIIYLHYHDELPWNYEIECHKDENDLDIRPKNTNPCHDYFYVREKDIFIKNDCFFQICPHCGYLNRIASDILSDSLKKRIQSRCKLDEHLFRKMWLYSELFSLEKNEDEAKKLLKKKIG